MSRSAAWTTILLSLVLLTAAAVLVLQLRLETRVTKLDDELSGKIARLERDSEHQESYRALRVVPPGKRDILYPAAETYRPGRDIKEFQASCRSRLMDLMGLDRHLLTSPVELKILGTERLDSLGVIREKVEFGYSANTGWVLRGYLLYPVQAAARLPGILCLNGHGGEAAAVAGIKLDYTNCYGMALARDGFEVLTFDWCFEGESSLSGAGGKSYHGHDSLFDWMEAGGRSGLALYMENAWCAFKALSALSSVDTTRLGVSGISRGGELTTYFAALFAPEIDAYYASGAGFPFVYRRFGGGCKCTYVERIFDDYEFSDLMIAAAPTPARLQLGVKDGIWGYWDNIEYVMQAVGPVYDSLGEPGNFGLDIHPGKHVYQVDQGLAFFRRFLKK